MKYVSCIGRYVISAAFVDSLFIVHQWITVYYSMKNLILYHFFILFLLLLRRHSTEDKLRCSVRRETSVVISTLIISVISYMVACLSAASALPTDRSYDWNEIFSTHFCNCGSRNVEFRTNFRNADPTVISNYYSAFKVC